MAHEGLLTKNFVLTSLASFAFFASMYFLLPALPLYITQLGGEEGDVGLIMGAFTVTSVLLRPFVGRWVDTWRRKPFLLLGAGIFVAASLSYNLARSVPMVFLVRAFHGAGIACFTTASSTFIADIVPPSRRGAAMGYFGMFSNIAMAIGPFLGGVLMRSFDLTTLFAASAAMGIIALSFVAPLHEALPATTGQQASKQPALISRSALFPSAIMSTLSLTYGTVLSFLPLLAANRQIDHFEVFFTVYAVTLILVRSVAGELSDRWGRATVVIPGMFLVAMAVALLAITPSLPVLLGAAVLYGLGFGAVHPSLMAFTVDRAGIAGRGAAMGTFSAAFDLGIGLGSVLLGYVLQVSSFTTMYLMAAGLVIVGLGGFVVGTRAGEQRNRRVEEPGSSSAP